MMTATKIYTRAVPSGRTIDPCDWRSNPLPEYKLEGTVAGYDDRVQLPDGSLAYVVESNSDGTTGLYREIIAMDAGDNVVRRWRAEDRGIAGITAPTGPNGTGLSGQRGQLTCLGDKQIGWIS